MTKAIDGTYLRKSQLSLNKTCCYVDAATSNCGITMVPAATRTIYHQMEWYLKNCRIFPNFQLTLSIRASPFDTYLSVLP